MSDMVIVILGSFIRSWGAPALLLLVVLVAAYFGVRWIMSEHLEALRSVKLFQGLSRRQLKPILRAAHATEFLPGQSIVTEGETGKSFYILTEGSATVEVGGAEVATLGPGSYFGEMAALDRGQRAATIVASSRVSTLELTASALATIIDREPTVARALAEELCERLRLAGDPVTIPPDAVIDRNKVVELSERLRQGEHPDWVLLEGPPRSLRFTRFVVRGRETKR
jgi:CRP-like cAMP-binding protein